MNMLAHSHLSLIFIMSQYRFGDQAMFFPCF
jgi:hypothetical protein